jgi:hypothetical protein
MAWKSVAAQVAPADENGVGRSLRESTSSGFKPAFDLSTNAVRKRAGSRRALLGRHILGKLLRWQASPVASFSGGKLLRWQASPVATWAISFRSTCMGVSFP